jgi:hypothetical protein
MEISMNGETQGQLSRGTGDHFFAIWGITFISALHRIDAGEPDIHFLNGIGALRAARPVSVIRYSTSVPLPRRSIQPRATSFDLNVLSGSVFSFTQLPPRRYCMNWR